MATNIPVDPNGNVPTEDRGVAVGGFWPDPSAIYPGYTTPGDEVPPTVDAAGNRMGRGSVLTDEGGFREHFPGAALDPAWTSSIGAGGAIAVAASKIQITSGVVAGAKTYISRLADFMPIAMSVKFVLDTRVGAATGGREFFFGFYNDPDPALATEYVEWHFNGAVAANTASECATQAHTGAGGTEGIGTNVVVTSTTSDLFKQIVLDGESAIYRDGQITLPNTTVEATRSVNLPSPYAPLYVAMGWRNLAAPGATSLNAFIDTVYVKNLNRVVVNTAF